MAGRSCLTMFVDCLIYQFKTVSAHKLLGPSAYSCRVSLPVLFSHKRQLLLELLIAFIVKVAYLALSGPYSLLRYSRLS